jgi:Calx-beta domain-containing protein/carboxypeptidase family protein
VLRTSGPGRLGVYKGRKLRGVQGRVSIARGLRRGFTVTALFMGVALLAGPSAADVLPTISGSVTSSGTGLGGVTVTLSSALLPPATTSTASDGTYAFADVVDGDYTVTPTKANYAMSPLSQDVTVGAANVSDVDFSATLNQHTISGQITRGGSPLSGVTVTLSGGAAGADTTDGSGGYSFNVNAGGTYTVTPSLANHSFMPASQTFSNVTSNQTQNFSAVLNQHTISGQITRGGSPLSGVTVTLTGTESGSTTANASGNYSFANLDAGGSYTVTPTLANNTFTPPSATINGLSQNETRNFSATLNQHTISGQITRGGSPLSGVTVTLTGTESGSTTANASGNYSFANLDAGGSYTVTPSLANNTFTPPNATVTNLSTTEMRNFAATLIRLSVTDIIVAETGGNATFTAALKDQNGNPVTSDKPVTFNYSTANGTAQAGSDYSAQTNQPVTVPAGVTSASFQVAITDDALDELDETFLVNLSNVQNAEVQDGQGQATITDDDALPNVSISPNVTQLEGNTGTTTFLFTVSLSAPSGKTVTVSFLTQNGTAVSGGVAPQNDYQHISGTLTFNPTETSKTIPVLVNGDMFNEASETFTVNLSSPSNANLQPGQGAGTGTITNDDGQPSLSVEDKTVAEGAGTASFKVTLAPASGQTVTVNYATSNGPAPAATSGTDYASASNLLSFAPTEVEKTITIPITQDTLDEPEEKFTISLSNESNAAVSKRQGIATITDDDNPPTVAVGDVTVLELNAGASGTTNAVFNVSLSASSGQTVTIGYATSNGPSSGGALQPADYTLTTGTLMFNPGEPTTKTVSVPVKGDALDEPDETFSLNLSSPVNVTIADGQGIATITDDDPSPSLSISDSTVADDDATARDGEGFAGQGTCAAAPFSQCAVFTVSLSVASGQTVTVTYATSDGTAGSADYAFAGGVLTFSPGETSETVKVPIKGDTSDEFNETFSVNLSAATNATIADGQGVGTIVDDDGPPALSVTGASDSEGNPDGAIVVVALAPASGQQVSVTFSSTNGSAVAGTDYVSVPPTTLVFAPGQTSKAMTIKLFNDTVDEADETFTVNLSNPQNAIIKNDPNTGRFEGTGVVTIRDDDPLPIVSIGDATVTEGNSGSVNASFAVTLSADSARTISVNYATVNGSALEADDFSATSGTSTFASGETSKTLTVPVNGDTAFEPDESFTVNLAHPNNAEIGDATGLGTIANDDAQPTDPGPTTSSTTTQTTTTNTTSSTTTTRTNRPPLRLLTGMGVSKAPVTLLDNLAPIGVTCSRRATRNCFGVVTVQGHARSLSIVGGRPTAKLIRLGREEYAIRRGTTEKVLVPLSKRAVKAVNRGGKLRVTVVVTARDSAGKRAKPLTRALWLKAAKKIVKKKLPPSAPR